jgi:penicillin-binding protein 1A
MYICNSYVPVVHRDTTRRDSHVVTNEEIILDEDGNPIEQSSRRSRSPSSLRPPSPSPQEKKHREETQDRRDR